jgi:bacteriocin-like protein
MKKTDYFKEMSNDELTVVNGGFGLDKDFFGRVTTALERFLEELFS